MLIIAACALIFVIATPGYAANFDWKLYGRASVAGPSFCFYEASSVAKASGGNTRVWTKCLAQKDLEGVDPKSNLGTEMVNEAAKRLTAGYVPPIIVIGGMEFNQAPDIVAYEEIADHSAIEPQSLIFIELNCRERMMRNLSTSTFYNGRRGFNVEASDWDYVPPEGNGATLLKLLCTRQ